MQLSLGFCAFYRAVSIDSNLRVFSSWSKRDPAALTLFCFYDLHFRFSIAMAITKLLLLVASVMCKHLAAVTTLLWRDSSPFTSKSESLQSFLQKSKPTCLSHVRSCRSSVSGLLLPCSPHAILWRVSQIIVHPLQRISARAIAHISKKVFKTIYPSFAYRYSTCAVSIEGSVSRIATTLFHALPNFVKWMPIHSVSSFSHIALQSLYTMQYLTSCQRIGV